ncbi:hypothetical protein CLUG_05673 [Clavispora lusitaniae ATCC 42720]|uniref:ABC transporter domain-containing protein n=2 Tax=Clavispora lusitaniae TaxID=36911 RepID=C4YBU5_CLAL4|nr:uncharacterized protein CLUG_05673 [Clavispora lusitaniae ATCC 42720]EEQ41545.1 hypothetical protein CLUG_05673 [Clavispora lusitaniae ATCC 42720]
MTNARGNCLVQIKNALFRTHSIKSKNQPYVFRKPIEKLELFRPNDHRSFWGILGPKKSALMNVLAGNYIAEPPTSRKYPIINDFSRKDQIGFLDFRESSGLDKVHLSARYESYSYKGKLEMADDCNSVKNYITGKNNYNRMHEESNEDFIHEIMDLFNLGHLQSKWISSLSNGQMRRARIAKALMDKPKLLLIDDPFLGLDPVSTLSVSNSLRVVAQELDTCVVLGLRIQDEIPDWVNHLAFVTENGTEILGERKEVEKRIMDISKPIISKHKAHNSHHQSESWVKKEMIEASDPIIEFKNACVAYKGQTVLKNLDWKIQRGSKWRILGNNGTGKTTLLSLITADHPQSWRSVVTINGVTRKTGSGVTYFDVNDKIGISSPELHALVPPRMTMMSIITNGLVRGIGNANFSFKFKEKELGPHAVKLLKHFESEIKKNENKRFHELTVSLQKLTLFLRAVIKSPDILILDEAFSCMDDEELVIKCHEFIKSELGSTTILTIGHLDWEVPETDFTLKLLGDENRGYEYYERIK